MLRRLLSRFLEHRRLPVLLALLGVVLCLPALRGGLAVDDLFQRIVLLGADPFGFGGDQARIDMFRFFDGDSELTLRAMGVGFVPWWTLPAIEISFLRPVTAATHLLDYVLWPEQPWLMHLHSLLWFGALVAAVTVLYRRIGGVTAAAGLAALLYAVDDAHGFAIGWVANRNALIAALLGVLAILAHVRWAQSDRLRHGVLALLCLVFGLLAGEAAVAAGAYIFAHSLWLDRSSWRVRAARLAPYAAVGIGWLALHRVLGYGALGSGLYIDPTKEPLSFLAAACERVPIALAAQLVGPSASFHAFVTEASVRWTWWGWAVLVVLGVAVLLWRMLRREPEAGFWATGMLLSTIPISATFPHDRLLLFVGLGGMALVARLVVVLVEEGGRRARWVIVGAVMLVHVVLAGLGLPLAAYSPAVLARIMSEDVRVLPDDPALASQDLVLVNPNVPFLAGYYPIVRWSDALSVPKRLRILGPGTTAMHIERVDARTLRVRPEAGFLSAPMDDLFRSVRYPMAAGETVTLPGLRVEIVSVNDAGRPAEALFRFDTPLEDPSLRWLAWRDSYPEPFVPPPIGSSVTLPAQHPLPVDRMFW
jgi:hypothetical protein